ncbi:MAG: hypothetical protein K0S07_1298 [Chlamydiales bacterium]|jgi:hypothetical protein|nr:hypothetical protein [Chlamydiales bacterium]
MKLLLKIFFCIFISSLALYVHLEKQNELTELRMEIPILERQVRVIGEENRRLSFEIARFENPAHLLQLSKTSAFSHLKYPTSKEVLEIPLKRDGSAKVEGKASQ